MWAFINLVKYDSFFYIHPIAYTDYKVFRMRFSPFIKVGIVCLLCLLITKNASGQALQDVNSWLYQLQRIDIDSIAASSYDLVVMDYSSDGSLVGEFTSSQIQQLKISGKIVLSYMSIGEAEDYRYYWQSGWTEGNPSWLGPTNPAWEGNYKVRYWMDGWKQIIMGSPDAYLDKIIAAGFDGIYLDIIDAYYFFGPEGDMPENNNSANDMIQFVIEMADYASANCSCSNFYIFPQNGAPIIDDGSADSSTIYLQKIHGIGAEDTYFFGDLDENNPYDLQTYEHGLLEQFRDAGDLVIAVDYVTESAKIDSFYAFAEADAFIPFATVRALDTLMINPGHSPVGVIKSDLSVPTKFELGQNFPNPFNPATTIEYTLLGSGDVSLKIYNLLGEEVAHLVSEVQQAGYHQITWDASTMASGVYLYRLQAGNLIQIRKMLLLK